MNGSWPQLTELWGAQLLMGGQILLIVVFALIAQRLVVRGLAGLARRYPLPAEILLPIRTGSRWLIIGGALIMVLERFGVSATVLWTAISGFLAVAAVAFFAMWSVLSNLLCTVFILSVGSFRVGDRIEVIDSADKPGVRGQVVDINLLYTTLQETHENGDSNLVQIPNSLFFQKMMRRWHSADAATPPSLPHE